MQKCIETPYSTGSSWSPLSISYCECNELCIQFFLNLATVCTNIKWASATSSTICNNCIILFTATFIKETACFSIFIHHFLNQIGTAYSVCRLHHTLLHLFFVFSLFTPNMLLQCQTQPLIYKTFTTWCQKHLYSLFITFIYFYYIYDSLAFVSSYFLYLLMLLLSWLFLNYIWNIQWSWSLYVHILCGVIMY